MGLTRLLDAVNKLRTPSSIVIFSISLDHYNFKNRNGILILLSTARDTPVRNQNKNERLIQRNDERAKHDKTLT